MVASVPAPLTMVLSALITPEVLGSTSCAVTPERLVPVIFTVPPPVHTLASSIEAIVGGGTTCRSTASVEAQSALPGLVMVTRLLVPDASASIARVAVSSVQATPSVTPSMAVHDASVTATLVAATPPIDTDGSVVPRRTKLVPVMVNATAPCSRQMGLGATVATAGGSTTVMVIASSGTQPAGSVLVTTTSWTPASSEPAAMVTISSVHSCAPVRPSIAVQLLSVASTLVAATPPIVTVGTAPARSRKP